MKTPFPEELHLHRWGHADHPHVFFLHANSYAANMYEPFLVPLFEMYHVVAPDLPGCGDSRWNGQIHDWEDLADYYISKIEQQSIVQTPMTGMGHSIGGIITLIMAIKKPEWFTEIILLDPVLLPKHILWAMRLFNLFSIKTIIPLAKAASRRRTSFSSREQALEHFRKKAIFSGWQTTFLEHYVDDCLYPVADGSLQLSCPPHLEASIYQSVPVKAWSLPRKLNVPGLILAGDHSDTLRPRSLARLERLNRNLIVRTIHGGHLFPFENPAAAMQEIREFLKQ